MEIKKTAIAGTLESSDVQIVVSPTKKGIHIDLESDVKKQFGKAILKQINSVLKDFNIENIDVKVIDKGALDIVIKARMITAIQRALELEEPKWEVL